MCSRAALAPFSVLVTRYLDSDVMQEYLLAFLKFGFSQTATNYKFNPFAVLFCYNSEAIMPSSSDLRLS